MLENCLPELWTGVNAPLLASTKSSGRKSQKKIYKGEDPLTLTQQFCSVRCSTTEAWPIPLVMWRCPGTLATSMLLFTRKMTSKFWPSIFGHFGWCPSSMVQLNFTNLEKKHLKQDQIRRIPRIPCTNYKLPFYTFFWVISHSYKFVCLLEGLWNFPIHLRSCRWLYQVVDVHPTTTSGRFFSGGNKKTESVHQ